ncbi:MAG: PhnD/SsuA/transferrin family substrate-binding protein [Methylobacter sp.]
MKLIQARLLVVILFMSCNFAYAEETPDKKGRLMMGFYSSSISEQANRADIEVSLNFWAKDLLAVEAKKLNLNITSSGAILFDRIEDMEQAFERGELDMIVAPPLLIARYFKREALDDGFMGVLADKKQDAVLLVARTDKNINSAKDLRGKRLVMQENDELAEMFLDTEVLKALKKTYNNIGLTIQHQKKSPRIILDVYFDKADAAVLYKSTYDITSELNPEIRNKIKILADYPIRSKNFGYFRVNYPFNKGLSDSSKDFNKNARAQQILEVFKTPEIDSCKVAELDDFDKLYNKHLQLKQHAKK